MLFCFLLFKKTGEIWLSPLFSSFSKKEIIIDHSFNERLIADIIGETLFEEYFNLIQENKYKMYNIE